MRLRVTSFNGLSFLLYYYESSHIVSFECNASLDSQTITLLSLYSPHTLPNPTSLYLVAYVSSTFHTPSLIHWLTWLSKCIRSPSLHFEHGHMWLMIFPSVLDYKGLRGCQRTRDLLTTSPLQKNEVNRNIFLVRKGFRGNWSNVIFFKCTFKRWSTFRN